MEESVVKLTALTGKGWDSTEVEMVRLSSYPCLAQCMGRCRQIDRAVDISCKLTGVILVAFTTTRLDYDRRLAMTRRPL